MTRELTVSQREGDLTEVMGFCSVGPNWSEQADELRIDVHVLFRSETMHWGGQGTDGLGAT